MQEEDIQEDFKKHLNIDFQQEDYNQQQDNYY
jgi:hypothetical protein